MNCIFQDSFTPLFLLYLNNSDVKNSQEGIGNFHHSPRGFRWRLDLSETLMAERFAGD